MALDMRKVHSFPPPPTCGADFDYERYDPWDYACAMVDKYDSRQFVAFRKVCQRIGNVFLCFDILREACDILAHSHNIKSPGAFVMAELKNAALACAHTRARGLRTRDK